MSLKLEKLSKEIDSILEEISELKEHSESLTTFKLVEEYAEDNLNLESMDDTAICLCLERLCQIEDLNRLSSKWLELIKWSKKEAYENLKKANVIFEQEAN
jgi:hypothetical protein